jgi:N-acylneuraminate cytidylyltransferase
MIHNMRVVALVPMKEHSERVPGKNLRPFSGKPLFHHILGTLERTLAVDEVVVDTDSEEIGGEARDLFRKVRVLPRPEELCGDMVSMNRVIAHDISQVASDIYLQTHATNPLLRSETITRALRRFVRSEDCDSLFSVNRYQSRFYTGEGEPINHDPTHLIRTQDLEPIFEENSALYVFTRASFESTDRRIGRRPFMFETDRIEGIDIDDEYTFRLAEMLAGYARGGL